MKIDKYYRKHISFKHTMNETKHTYYTYENERYSIHFPLHWAIDHLPDTGPNKCSICKSNGNWNGVFIGYCSKCAIDEYDGSRGRGFSYPGVENTADKSLHIESAFTTYMQNICLDDIGSKHIEDTQALLRDNSTNCMVARYIDTNLLHQNACENTILKNYLAHFESNNIIHR